MRCSVAPQSLVFKSYFKGSLTNFMIYYALLSRGCLFITVFKTLGIYQTRDNDQSEKFVDGYRCH